MRAHQRLRALILATVTVTAASCTISEDGGDALAGGSSGAVVGVTEDTVRLGVPPDTTATVLLPGAEDEPIEVGSGRHQWRVPDPPGRGEHPGRPGGLALAADPQEAEA